MLSEKNCEITLLYRWFNLVINEYLIEPLIIILFNRGWLVHKIITKKYLETWGYLLLAFLRGVTT